MTTYQYPSITELQEIEQLMLPKLIEDDPIFQIMPMVDVDSDLVEWDQQDNYGGLQAIRGLGGQPGNVTRVGAKRYTVRPGYYGETGTLNEQDLTSEGRLGVWNQPADVSRQVRGLQDQLLNRRINRIRKIGWDVLQGTYSVANNNGVLVSDTFSVQTYNASTWSTVSTATPLADMRGAQLLSEGYSVDFGAGATAYLNRRTANYLLANTNAADLYGKRTSGLANVMSLAETNNVLAMEDLPRLRIWHEGYHDDDGTTFHLFIPTNVIILVGRRAGDASLMDFALTRNANNPNSAPGSYTFVKDNTSGPAKTVPPTIEVHDGFNGAPRIYFPSAIVILDVS